MRIIERNSGLEGLILRPLSAKLLEPTIHEKRGLVDRVKLLAIEGRSRKLQIQLASQLGINDYPCPAGGESAEIFLNIISALSDYGDYIRLRRFFSSIK